MPAYHNVVLQNYMPVFNKNSKLLTEVLADQCRLRKFIDIEDYAMRSTLDTSMGNFICQTGEDDSFPSLNENAPMHRLLTSLTFAH